MRGADKPLAAVTGGTGFLGRYILRALMDAGWRLRLLVRREPMHPLIRDLDAEIVPGDLADPFALERLCVGADAIIHAAGLIKAKSRAAFFAVNAEGSARLARAAARMAPGAHLTLVSSMAAREPDLSDYAASKRAAEEAFLENAAGPVTILRPPAIYGPWDRETLPLFRMASKGVVMVPAAPLARICLIEASDAARAVAALTGAGVGGMTYELSDEVIGGYTWHEIACEAGRTFGREPRVIGLPPRLCLSVGALSGGMSRLAGRVPMLTRGKVREMLHGDWSSSPANQPPPGLWRPRIGLREGFGGTARWLEQQGWL